MVKTCAADEFQGLSEACGGMLSRLVRREHGMTKAASECFDKQAIEQHRPGDDRHALIHFVAMGAHETYGANRNSDAFERSELKAHHPTFVKCAHLFREHRNHDPKLAIGIIKASAYNDVMDRVELLTWLDREKAEAEFEKVAAGKELSGSMACFPGNTLVQMADGSEKPIQDIVVGDSVRTHKGNVGEVLHTMQRDYADAGVAFRAFGLPDDILATAEHPIWIRPSSKTTLECPVCGAHCRQLRSHLRMKKDVKHQAAYRDFGRYAEGFRRADLLAPGDWVRTPFSTEVNSNGNETYAAILGWYVAEGNVFDSDKYTDCHWCTDFTLNTLETVYADEIRELLLAYGVEDQQISIYNEPEVGRCRVRCRNVPLMRRLIADGGKLAPTKCLSEDVMKWQPVLQRIILEKALEGDGDWHKENEVSKVTTTSRRLAWQLAEIAWRNGVVAHIQKYSGIVGKVREIKNRNGKVGPIISKHSAYYVSIPASESEKLSFDKRPRGYTYDRPAKTRSISHLKHQVEGAVGACVRAQIRVFIENGFVYRRIWKIRRKAVFETVYDLTIPGDHGFVVTGVGVSNCKIAFDVANCCGKKSRTTADYCDHMKKHATKYLPELRKYAFVFNPNPRFIDYSVVARPADRIAHYIAYRFGDQMQKAASEDMAITGADWAAFYGISEVNDEFIGTLRKMASVAAELADPLACLPLTHKAAFIRDILPASHPGQFSDREVDAMRRLRPPTLWRELAKRAAVLPFYSFASYLTGKPVSEIEKDASWQIARRHVRDLPGWLAGDGLKFACGVADQFEPGSEVDAQLDPESDDEIDRLLAKADDEFAGTEMSVGRRLRFDLGGKVRRCGAEESKVASIILDENNEAMLAVRAYGVYKASALTAIENLHGVNEALEMLVTNLD